MTKQANESLVSIDSTNLADVSGGFGGWGAAYRAATLAAIANGAVAPAPVLPYYAPAVVPYAPVFRRYWHR